MTFHQPSVWFLLLALLMPLLWWRWLGVRRRASVAFSSTAPFRHIRPSWAVRVRWVVPVLRSLVLVVLIICIARPLKADEQTRVRTEGIAIQLVLDRSGSMQTDDFTIGGRRTTRLAVVKDVVEQFVTGGDRLPGRPDDLTGLIAFGTFADSICPLTLDHDFLVEAIRSIEIPPIRSEQQTAIGDAIALGVERLQGIKEREDLVADREIRGKVMILLTDGESNRGAIDPITAADMAAAFDIRIYAIGAASDEPLNMMQRMRGMSGGVDEPTLREIASRTGGRYFRATDSESLREIYARIDELERIEIEQQRFTEYEEMATGSVQLGPITVPPLLTITFVLLIVELVAAQTRFRRLP
jgi:Ca-activated chloride channel family protein